MSEERNIRRERVQQMIGATYDYTLGKLPPQAVEFEEVILGAMLQDKDCLIEGLSALKAEYFYKEANSLIFEAITLLKAENKGIDILTITKQLRAMEKLELVTPVYVSQLTTKFSATDHFGQWCDAVIDKYVLRQIIFTCQQTMAKAYEESADGETLITDHIRQASELIQNTSEGEPVKLSQMSKEILDEVQLRNEVTGYMSGITSGIESIDRITGGWKKTDLVYLGARPSMGKTGLLVTMAINSSKKGTKAAVFSLEMSKRQIYYRVAAQTSGIDLEIVMNKQLDESRLMELNRSVGTIDNMGIYIDDTAALSVYKFKNKVAKMKKKYGIGIVFVDYVQLMTIGNDSKKMAGNREQEISIISRVLKQTAKENDVAIIALAQLSRALESRPMTARRPILSDLRESGSLEQDADLVGFLYRPEYYGITENEDGSSTAGYAEIIVAKHRNGKLGTAPMRFTEYTASFSSATPYGYPPDQKEYPSPDGRIEPNNQFLNNEEAPF